MTALTVQAVTAAGVTPAAPTQLAAWPTGDTIPSSQLGPRGAIVEVANASGGSLDLRVGDVGVTPANNPAANGYATITVPTGSSRRVLVTSANVDPATDAVKIGASTTNAAFTVTCYRQ